MCILSPEFGVLSPEFALPEMMKNVRELFEDESVWQDVGEAVAREMVIDAYREPAPPVYELDRQKFDRLLEMMGEFQNRWSIRCYEQHE